MKEEGKRFVAVEDVDGDDDGDFCDDADDDDCDNDDDVDDDGEDALLMQSPSRCALVNVVEVAEVKKKKMMIVVMAMKMMRAF